MRFFILLLFVLSTNIIAQPAIQILTNANGYTMTAEGKLQQFSTMVIKQGKVIEIGDVELASRYSQGFPLAEQQDLKGKTLLPGLIDAHGHLLRLGATLLQVDVRDISSAQATVDAVSDYAKRNPELSWLIGRGWNQEIWSGKAFPTAAMLDAKISQRPVFLGRVDAHAAWVNTKALELAGIDESTPDPAGGKIMRDAQGKATGILIDRAVDLIRDKIPKETNEVYRQQLTAVGEHLLGLGVTGMHDAGISYAEYLFYQQQANANALPMRIYAMIGSTDPQLKKMLEAGHINLQQDYLSIRSVKAYGDGALGSRGAALLAPYSDAPKNHGLLLTAKADMPNLFNTVIQHGFQLNYHAIGDKANRFALFQFATSYKQVGGRSLRHRIEHAQVIAPSDIPRFKQLDVIPSMQPTHATSDMNMAQDRVGKDRLKGAYAWKTFFDQGSPVAFGSDFPVELANPFYGIHAAVTRQDRKNRPVKGWRTEEAVTVEQAFLAFTLNAAYAAHQEKILGSLEPGKWADFIVVDQDIFKIAAQDLWKTQVLETWIAGEQKFKKVI